MLKDEFWCILYTKFDTFVIGLVHKALQKNVLRGNPPTPLPNYLFYRPLLIWTNVSNVSESQNVSVSSRLGNHDVSSRSRLGQNSQCLGLVSVSDTWVSCLVSVSALKVSWTSLRDRVRVRVRVRVWVIRVVWPSLGPNIRVRAHTGSSH